MALSLKKVDYVFLSLVAAGLLAVAGLGFDHVLARQVAIFFVGCVFIVLLVQLEIYRRLRRGQLEEHAGTRKATHRIAKNTYIQMESYEKLQSALSPATPWPPFDRHWAITAETAIVILRFVQRVDPQLVVECGSGMSSFVIGRALQLKGSGKCIAFEDDRAYAERHREELREAGLSEYVEVYHTPIREHEISGKRWLWYDIDGVTIERNIDLLFVDGPKGKLQPMSRYPAVPVLKDRLTSGAVVLLDDAQRGDERKIAARWQEEFAPTHSEFIDGAKATHYLRF